MNIVIINTNCANLFSIKTMLNKLGYNPIISCDRATIEKADKLFLPGVGHVSTAMKYLKKKKLIETIKSCTQPILGICLGMQLFGNTSEENKNIETLKIIDTPIKRIQYSNLPLPHMGWNNVSILKMDKLFNKIEKNHYFYFAHNYYIPFCNATIAQTKYGITFSSIIKHNNFYGVQFHPEKSSKPGRQLIKNFLEL